MWTHRKRQRGQALVEMTLILPIALVMTLGLIDAGRAVYAHNVLSTATRQAARYGAVYGGSQHPSFNWAESGNHSGTYAKPVPSTLPATTVTGTVAAAAVALDPAELSVEIASQVDTGVPGCGQFSPGCSTVRVTATYTFRPVTPLFSSADVPLSSTATAAIE